MTLAEFLLARIAEDEQAASNARWCDRPGYGASGADYDTVSDCDCGDDHASSSYLAVDPQRVLAECDAKRRIVEGWGPFETYNGEELLKVLALPYADHPDYREEWKP